MTTTKEIRTWYETVVCDVCGRTLLRGERADVYFAGAARRLVCELCKPRALHEGWVREGSLLEYGQDAGRGERRRPLLARLRGRRAHDSARARSQQSSPTVSEAMVAGAGGAEEPDWAEGRFEAPGSLARPGSSALGRVAAAFLRPRPAGGEQFDGEAAWEDGDESGRASMVQDGAGSQLAPVPRERAVEPRLAPLEGEGPSHARGARREPRHVHAVPASREQRCAAAVELFNRSEHCRTVAGVARSLGEPLVRVEPVSGQPGLVELLVAWELCWYRYEVDLSAEAPSVRVAAQGAELAELGDGEPAANARASADGRLSLARVQ